MNFLVKTSLSVKASFVNKAELILKVVSVFF